MRVKISNTWKAKVHIELPGDNPAEPQRGTFTAEFAEVPMSEIKANDKTRRQRQRQLDQLQASAEPDYDEIGRIEDALANADRELLDRVLIRLHGLELERSDGELMTQSEMLDYVKDHVTFAVAIIRTFADQLGGAPAKNSKRSGKH